MDLIEWRSEFLTGIASVDHEHKELVDLINTLHREVERNPDEEAVGQFLGEVFARISAHFALEESLMRKHRYDEYASHKQEHEKLLDDLRDIMDDHRDAGADYRTTLGSTVRDWFVTHFKTADARLHRKLGH